MVLSWRPSWHHHQHHHPNHHHHHRHPHHLLFPSMNHSSGTSMTSRWFAAARRSRPIVSSSRLVVPRSERWSGADRSSTKVSGKKEEKNDIFLSRESPHHHPVLYLRGVKKSDVAALLDFMYHGEARLLKNKVKRCLARYSPRATTTNQPTNRAPNGIIFHFDQRWEFQHALL